MPVGGPIAPPHPPMHGLRPQVSPGGCKRRDDGLTESRPPLPVRLDREPAPSLKQGERDCYTDAKQRNHTIMMSDEDFAGDGFFLEEGAWYLTESSLIDNPCLTKLIGLKETMVLQTLHTCLEKSSDIINNCRWVCYTHQQWQEMMPFLSISSLRRNLKKLEEVDLIRAERLRARRYDQRKWYTIRYHRLEMMILEATHGQGKS